MANEKHLEILKQGVEVWNTWKANNHQLKPDFDSAELDNLNLKGANLRFADFNNANLNGSDLRNANLIGANISIADFSGVNLASANLTFAYLRDTNLSGTDLTKSKMGWTVFADLDLSSVKGLDAVEHRGPSSIGIDTIYKSKGEIPEVFLRGVGLLDNFITYVPSLTAKAIQFYSCFISYSSSDQEFAERLYADLQSKGVRCWFAPEDIKVGDRIRDRIDEAIRLRDKLLLILSKNSISSNWVEHEVESALEEEQRRTENYANKTSILFPIRLDDTVMESELAWAALIRRTRHIGDFRGWKRHSVYQKAFNRLLHDLKSSESNEARA